VLKVGTRVEVKGRFLPDGEFAADEIEVTEGSDRDEELRGLVEWVDLEKRQLRLLGFTVKLPDGVEIDLEPSGRAGFEDLKPGLRIKVDGRRDESGAFVARSLRIRQDQRVERKIVGTIEVIETAAPASMQLRILGLHVVVNEATDLVKPGSRARPALVKTRLGLGDEEDLQFLGNHRLGGHLSFAGEFRLRGTVLSNPDLDETTADRRTVPELFATVGTAADFGLVSGYLEVTGQRKYFIEGGDEFTDLEKRGDFAVSQAYFQTGLDPGGRASLIVGRQKFTEERRWYYDNKNLDAARLVFDSYPFSVEASISRDLFDESLHLRDQNLVNQMVHGRYEVLRNLALEAYFIRRIDQTNLHDSPVISALRGIGDIGRHFSFWLDLAREGGTRGRVDTTTGTIQIRHIRAWALDTAVTFRPRILLDPTFTAGYAIGSGDEPAHTGADGTFRQSGLQRNRDSLHGVVSFRYYGEVINPELSNLRILTLGEGIRPSRVLSIDVVFHDYRQDVPARRLENTDIDARPSGLSPHIGHEVDLIVGYEPRKELELRLTAGRFFPGSAFLDKPKVASIVTLQSRFRF